MNALAVLAQIPLQTQRLGGAYPFLGAFAVAHIVLAAVFVAALVYVAWKVGAYYDAAKKKL